LEGQRLSKQRINNNNHWSIKDQRWGIAEAKFVCNALPGEQANVKVFGFVLGICVEPLNFFLINENDKSFAFCFKKIYSLR
jgi:hypothetical protein